MMEYCRLDRGEVVWIYKYSLNGAINGVFRKLC